MSRTLATTQSGPCVLVREREPQVELENAYAKASNSLSASMRLRQELNYTGPGIQSYVISWFTRRDGNGDWELHMHPQMATALELLGWVKTTTAP